jgi:branched-chain amino acid transport system substrate-binding protein
VGLGAAVAVVALVLAGRSSHRSNVPVAPNSVARIDARSNRVAADVPVGLTPTSVSFGEGAVWVLNADDQTLTRVDPDTGRAVTFGSGGVPTDVAAGAGGVWVGNGRRSRAQFVGPIASTVSRIDPRTRAVYSTVSLARTGGSISNRNENHIVVGAGAVWVVGPDGSVFRVDPRSATIAATVRSISADAIAAGPDEVWALEQGGMLARIGTRTNRVEQRVPIAATGLDSLAVGFGSVWAVDPYDGTLWRVDARRRPVERTIPVGVGASDVAVGSGAVWVANALRGTVSRIDPRSNRVVATIDVGNTPRHLAVGGGSVWVTVAGAPASSTPASGTLAGGSALPATSCGRVIYGGPGHPDRLIVSDMPLRGGSRLATTQLAAAIEYELRARGFRAGRFHVGYQSCDDSTAQTGIFDSQKCAANAHLFAANRAVIGEVGPFNSGCALAQIPVLGRAPEGPVAMVSPTNSDVTLTRDGPISPRGGLQGLYPSGRRNYVRVFPAEDMQAAANAVLARRLGARRVAVVSDGGYGEAELAYFPRAARQLGLRIVLTKRWNPRARDYGGLVELIAARHPDAVLLSGLLDSNGGELLRAVRRRLPKATVLATDGFLPISGLFRAARSSARGVYVTLAGLAPPTLGPEGRHFVRDFGATHPGQDVDPAAPYAAQAADVLLDAIGRSDGSRRSATRELLATHVRQGILGDLEFDANGDTTSNPVTVLRAVRGGGSSRVGSYDGADIVSVIRPPARLVR